MPRHHRSQTHSSGLPLQSGAVGRLRRSPAVLCPPRHPRSPAPMAFPARRALGTEDPTKGDLILATARVSPAPRHASRGPQARAVVPRQPERGAAPAAALSRGQAGPRGHSPSPGRGHGGHAPCPRTGHALGTTWRNGAFSAMLNIKHPAQLEPLHKGTRQ